jgi:acyl-CoA carboxylase epsilon subunit
MTGSGPGGSDPGQPLFRVVAGRPSPAEVAAVTVVLAAKLAASTTAATTPPEQHRPAGNAWSDPARRLRLPLSPGPGAWRRSAWPR